MRIKIVQVPGVPCIDGIRLDWLVPGFQYDVGNLLGAYLLAEGWAEPLDELDVSAAFDDLNDADDDRSPANLKRETYPPYYDGPALSMDRRGRRRPR